MKKVAIIIGHNATERGAVAFNGESEFEYNLKVANYVKTNFMCSQLRVFIKSRNYVKNIKAFNPDLIVELHFNSFYSKAYGSEALVLEASLESIVEAKKLTLEFKKRFGIKNRGIKELHGKFNRGFTNFNGLRQYSMFLFEPCFANFETGDSKKIIENWIDYGDFLIDYFNFYFGYSEKVTDSLLDRMISMVKSFMP